MQTDRKRQDYFRHDADMGVIGRGATAVDAMVHAAEATFALQTDLDAVVPSQRVDFEFVEDDPELALVTWINLLLAHGEARGLALGRFTLVREDDRGRGTAWGEPWRDGLERGVAVKGATLTMLSVAEVEGEWEARCVVDV